MKRKIFAAAGIMASMLFLNSMAYADVILPEDIGMDFSVTEEAVVEDNQLAPLTEEENEKPLEAFAASSDNFVDVQLVASNNEKYTLVANIAYSYNKDTKTTYATGAQITNIKGESRNALIDIVIPDTFNTSQGMISVISIGEAAFDSCYASSITVPSSVLEICDRAFVNCPNLKTINIVGSDETPTYTDANGRFYEIATVIGNNAVSNCSKLETANINGFKTIGSSLFEGCTALKNVDVHINGFGVNANTGEPNKNARTATVADKMFYGCSSLESIKLMDGIRTVGKQTFVGCKALKKIEIGKTLTSALTYEDFISFTPVKANDIINAEKKENPTAEINSLNSSEKLTFDELSCSSLEEFVVDEENKSLSAIDGMLYNKNVTILYYCPLNTKVTSLIVPETVTSVNEYAFCYNPVILDLTVTGEKAITINSYAFYKSSIQKANLNRTGKVNVSADVFRACKSLSEVNTEYNHGGNMGNYAFMNCDSLTGLTLRGWANMGNQAFSRCDKLASVTLDYGVGTINDRCFEKCPALKSADLWLGGSGLLTNSKPKFGTYIFSECTALETASLPGGLLGISTGTFNECKKLNSVKCGDDIGTISSLAFNNCTSLKEISDIRFLVKIYANAFVNCTSLDKLTLTRSVLEINEKAFVDCPKLVLYTPAGYDGELFAQNNNIKYKNITDDIQDYEFLCYYPVVIGNNGNRTVNTSSLYAGSDLISAGIVPDSNAWVIGGYRGGFRTIKFPTDNTCLSTYIHDSWINKCCSNDCSVKNYLTSVDLGNVEYVGANAFNGIKNLTTLKTSPVLKEIGKSAFSGCSSLKGDGDKNALMLPLSMKLINENAFSGCTSLIKVDTDLSNIDDNNISDDFKIAKLAFSGCTSLKEFNTAFLEYDIQNEGNPDAQNVKYYLKEIGESAFKNCTSLEKVYFNGNLEKIAPKAFENCTGLTAVTLDNSVLVQTNAFIGCTNLTNAIIVGEANVAVSNDPFCSSEKLSISTTDNSKAQTYVDYKNQNNNNSFTIEVREFDIINDKAYIKSYVNAPSDVVVYKNGKVMDTVNDFVLYTNVLTFEKSNANSEKNYVFYVNGVAVNGEYVVPEVAPQTLVVTVEEKDNAILGDANMDGVLAAGDSAAILQKTLNASYKMPIEDSVGDYMKFVDVDGQSGLTAGDSACVLQKVLNSAYVMPAEDK